MSFRIVLVEPEIPQNTGNVGRTCVATGCELHLIKPLGFELSDRTLKRAGLDYWAHLKWFVHEDIHSWQKLVEDGSRVHYFSTKAEKLYTQAQFQPGDWLVFGKETKGLDPDLLRRNASQVVKIPQPGPVRSLNLATAVAVAAYEGIRQLGESKSL